MKSIIRIPTDQYAYVEVEFEGSESEIISKYIEISNIYKNMGIGLSAKEFNTVLDNYLATANLSEEEYNKMSSEQKQVIQELKKAFKRAEAKNPTTNPTTTEMEALYSDTDRAAEHKFHDKYDEKCSICYKSKPH